MTQHTQEIPRRSRRRFLYELGVVGIGGVVSLAVAVPLVGFFVSVLLKEQPLMWVRVASLDEIGSTEPREYRVTFPGESASVPSRLVTGAFLIRRGSELLAFTNVCSHMGCPVRWLSWRQQIVCPCHAGTYDRWGQLLGGPPSSDLPLLLTRIEGNDVYIANRIVPRGVVEGV